MEVSESMGLDSSRRTPRRTLDHASSIGGRPLKILLDSGSTSNYLSAQECMVKEIPIEK